MGVRTTLPDTDPGSLIEPTGKFAFGQSTNLRSPPSIFFPASRDLLATAILVKSEASYDLNHIAAKMTAITPKTADPNKAKTILFSVIKVIA